MKRVDISTKKHPNTFALVDDENFEYINQWKWRCNNSGSGYAVRRIGNRTIHMHRVINQTPDGYWTDHINRNTLDNRGSNLRTVTPSLNILNSITRKDSKSGYRGVTWLGWKKEWRARITINKKQIFLGYFQNKDEAYCARLAIERRLISWI
jgi:hypothetical protein